MNFDNLKKEDKELIKDSMLRQSVSSKAEALECKGVIPKEIYEKQMNEADRLIYLVNVLNDKISYYE